MKTITKLGFAGAIALAAWACGGSSSGGGGTTNGTSGAASDLTTFEDVTTASQAAVMSYETNMARADMTMCQGVHDAYDAQMRPLVMQMMHMAGEMDDMMDAHGGMSSADMACVAAAMMTELDHHHTLACTFSDVASDRAEVARHGAAMLSFGGHMSERCGEMQRGLDGGAWSWGSMMSGCGDDRADGGMMGDRDSGHMMHGAGMMNGR